MLLFGLVPAFPFPALSLCASSILLAHSYTSSPPSTPALCVAPSRKLIICRFFAVHYWSSSFLSCISLSSPILLFLLYLYWLVVTPPATSLLRIIYSLFFLSLWSILMNTRSLIRKANSVGVPTVESTGCHATNEYAERNTQCKGDVYERQVEL